MMLKKIPFAALIAATCVPALASAQDPGNSVSIALPGISFTRSLNGAGENAKGSGSKLTLTSAAKRDNFRDPNGKLSNNMAPVLLAAVDNKKPFTLTARITPTFSKPTTPVRSISGSRTIYG